jgi:hypothetical protein
LRCRPIGFVLPTASPVVSFCQNARAHFKYETTN